MKVSEINNYLNKLFPYKDADEWDNVGLFRKRFKNTKINKAIVSLDISNKVINHAIKKDVKLIISHHPIFIDKHDKKYKNNKMMMKKLNKNKISIISLHTNYDKNKFGMNFWLSKRMNGNVVRKAFKGSYGNIFSLNRNINRKQLVSSIQENINPNYMLEDKSVLINNFKYIYICGGSGSSEIEYIINRSKIKVDAFITGEIKWNIWNLANDKNIKLFDVGHNIESIFIDHIELELRKMNVSVIKFPKIELSNN